MGRQGPLSIFFSCTPFLAWSLLIALLHTDVFNCRCNTAALARPLLPTTDQTCLTRRHTHTSIGCTTAPPQAPRKQGTFAEAERCSINVMHLKELAAIIITLLVVIVNTHEIQLGAHTRVFVACCGNYVFKRGGTYFLSRGKTHSTSN